MNHDHPDSPELNLLGEFLTAFGAEARAHARAELSPREAEEIGALSQGELPPEQREAIVPLLARNENAIEYLADLLKSSKT